MNQVNCCREGPSCKDFSAPPPIPLHSPPVTCTASAKTEKGVSSTAATGQSALLLLLLLHWQAAVVVN